MPAVRRFHAEPDGAGVETEPDGAGVETVVTVGTSVSVAPLRVKEKVDLSEFAHDREGFSLGEGFSSNKRKILRDHGQGQSAAQA
jgi:hypothetical protein